MSATIEIDGLRNRFGPAQALDEMTFTVHPGQVTGFVEPNGAGKSTTMSVVAGLDVPGAGTATLGGRPYRTPKNPLRHVGTLLDAGALQPSRSARNQMLWLAHSQGLKSGRVDEVIALAGLEPAAAARPAGTPSACGSGSASPPRCSATRRRSSTSCITAWTPRSPRTGPPLRWAYMEITHESVEFRAEAGTRYAALSLTCCAAGPPLQHPGGADQPDQERKVVRTNQADRRPGRDRRASRPVGPALGHIRRQGGREHQPEQRRARDGTGSRCRAAYRTNWRTRGRRSWRVPAGR
jgi:energy-coupling factor transporter ATP-binding protein EcfA2